MRILHVSYLHPAITPGGAQQVAFELFQASIDQGHEAVLISALEIGHEDAFGKPGAPIVPFHGQSNQYLFFPQFYEFPHLSTGDWRSVQFFREFVEQFSPDVIHFHHYHRIGVECIRAARLGAPHAVISLSFHEMLAICMADGQMVTTKDRQLCHAATPLACHLCFSHLRPEFFTLRTQRLQALLDECDAFIFPSEFLSDRYLSWGLSGSKSVVIPNGQIDLSGAFNRTSHSKTLNRFGFFGQFIDNKGIDIVLEALILLAREKRVPTGGIIFEINGSSKNFASGAYLERIQQLLETLSSMENTGIRIIDRGRYDRHELAGRMSTIDWVLVPSTWWEVFGLVVSEAWMFGRPVIAAAIGGLAERVKDDVNGYTFSPRDPRSLADRLSDLIGNEERWEAAHTGCERPWTHVDMLNAHISIWQEMRRPKIPPLPPLKRQA
ncbi:glycosyltransferase family 4 protein [Methyloferula stellata]|uniref:glycosyltransferase family 4 protein n=1 Tax=Methyloferula stellata TaxID=876270 RepID=UPI00036DA9F4|nr:glycosyltransferase family 4 protein [Methyloferula stellata]